MKALRSAGYLAATTVAAALVVVGVWLPWVSKRPDHTANGQTYYTDEWVQGLEAGLQGTDQFAVLLVLGVITATAVLLHVGRNPDVVPLAAGGVLAWWSGRMLRLRMGSGDYVVEPGLYLVVAGGVLLMLVGGGAMFLRLVAAGGKRRPSQSSAG